MFTTFRSFDSLIGLVPTHSKTVSIIVFVTLDAGEHISNNYVYQFFFIGILMICIFLQKIVLLLFLGH